MPRPDYDVINDRWPVSSVLQHYGIEVRRRTFKCPLHNDHTASGSVRIGKDGRERWRCHACATGGDSLDLVQAIEHCDRREAVRRLTGEDPAFQPPPMPPVKAAPAPLFDLAPIPPELVAQIRPGVPTPPVRHKSGKVFPYAKPSLVHVYRDGHGVVPLIVLRSERKPEGKFFTPLRWCRHHNQLVATAWKDGEHRLFYREPELERRPDDPVLVVEGEKVADLLGALPQFEDYVVITWHGGTDAVKHHDWSKLAGRRVTFWPDADRPKEDEVKGKGWRAMEKAAGLSQPAQVRILEPPMAWIDRKSGYDAADLMDDLEHDARKVRDEMEALAVPWQPPQSRALTLVPGEGPRYALTQARLIVANEESNWLVHLTEDPRFDHVLTYDVLDRQPLVDGRPLDEAAVRRLAVELTRNGPFFRSVTSAKLTPMLRTVAQQFPVNRLANRLYGLKWDGIPRHVLAYAGADTPDGSWARAAGWRWLVGLVRRILQPGWKHDGVLVLEGEQGLGKSRFFEAMGTPFSEPRYIELAKLSQDKDVQMKLGGRVVVELAEMTAHRAGESDAVKGMITQTHDIYRPPFGREVETFPRTCVFGGSTNERQYLKDMTGNRRYWIVKVTRSADIEALERDREQLLAEAMFWLRKANEPNWLSPEEEAMQREIAKDREIDMPQLDGLDEMLETWPKREITKTELWKLVGFEQTPQRASHIAKKLEQMMVDRGWVLGKHHRYSGQHRHNTETWKLPDLDPDIP